MEKLIEMLGKIVQALLSSKTIWLIIVAVAIFSLALLLLDYSGTESGFFKVAGLMETFGDYIGPLALASLALILAKVLIWVIGLLRDQFFA